MGTTVADLRPARMDVYSWANDLHTIQVQIQNSPDVSAYTWASMWRASFADTTDVVLPVNVASAATGLLLITLDCSLLTDANGVYDLQALIGGKPMTVLWGNVVLSGDVTR